MSDSSNTVLRNANLPHIALLGKTVPSLQHALGVICFVKNSPRASPSADTPSLHVTMPILDGEAACEFWLGDSATAAAYKDGIRYRRSENLLFGVIEMDEADTGPIPLQQATESAYQQIFALLDELELPFVYRFWNYMADINAVSHGLERYRQFNLGRQDAFLACGRNVVGELPSACALGTAKGPLQIAFLAGTAASLAIENPRQVNAYAYPEDYGPRSPTFSRASLLRLADGEMLFISGTASIVGHRTRHLGDVLGQTRETLANIEAVILEANRTMHHRWFNPSQLFYRVYVRHATDIGVIRDELRRLTGNHANAIFLQADICREDLLLEIETTAFSCERKITDKQ